MRVRVLRATTGRGSERSADSEIEPSGPSQGQLVWMAPSSPVDADGSASIRPGEIPIVQELRRERRLFKDDLVTFERDPHSTLREIHTTIPLLRLHCPKYKGCTAKETFSLST